MSPGDRAGLQLLGWISPGVHMRISSYCPRWEKAKDPGDKLILIIQEKKSSNMVNHKNLNFCTYHSFGNSLSCITAVKWDAYDVENTADNAGRPSGLPELLLSSQWLGWSVHMAKFPAHLPRSRLKKLRSRKPSQPALSYEHIENFTKNLKVRQDLGNRASPVNRAHVKRP